MKKILVIQNKRIGDVLISSVIANNIKKVFPESEVTYFVYDYTTGVLENNPNIDRIISVKEKELKQFGKLIRTARRIRAEKYDIIFDSYAKFQSRFLCLFSKAEIRTGFKRKYKTLKLPFYTHPVDFLDQKTLFCGKAIEDRFNMMDRIVTLKDPDYRPKIFLTEKEKNNDKTAGLKKPVVMFGILGSSKGKSMPFDYVAKLVDFVLDTYDVGMLFNYAPYQKEEAMEIYGLCKNKSRINMDIYESSIRGFCVLMDSCDLLIANEGGSIHIAKALEKPTFTIYSPYIDKGDWSSFEDGKMHQSIHLLEERPELFEAFTRDSRKKIEADPEALYRELDPNLILKKLIPFLEGHLGSFRKVDDNTAKSLP